MRQRGDGAGGPCGPVPSAGLHPAAGRNPRRAVVQRPLFRRRRVSIDSSAAVARPRLAGPGSPAGGPIISVRLRSRAAGGPRFPPERLPARGQLPLALRPDAAPPMALRGPFRRPEAFMRRRSMHSRAASAAVADSRGPRNPVPVAHSDAGRTGRGGWGAGRVYTYTYTLWPARVRGGGHSRSPSLPVAHSDARGALTPADSRPDILS